MTALAGFWNVGGSGDAGRSCERMLKAQQVYGPEPSSCWSDGDITLGRRLFKLLPEDVFDRAPVVGADGTKTLVADVRIDNRDDLCEVLQISPAEARLLSDAALFMRALERWDEEALDWIVGDFAFALWDTRRQRLLLARDFLGQRPLHYHRGRDFFAFASMAKGLHALSEIPVAPDRKAVADFLALIPETGSESFFENVERVQPGHIVEVTRNAVSSRKYWNPPNLPILLRSAEDYADALREQLDRAVAVRLRGADGRVAAQLSGGLDSSAVAATAARLLAPKGGSVTAFTSVPRDGYPGQSLSGRIADEGPLAASVADLYPNMEHIRISAGGNSPIAALDRYYFLYERPLLNPCNGVWFNAIMDAAKARRHSIMLVGTMGNMSFSYAGLERLPQLLSQRRLIRLSREAYLLRRNGAGIGALVAGTISPFLPAALWRHIGRLRGNERKLGDYSMIDNARVIELGLDRRAAGRGLDFSFRPRSDPRAVRLWEIGRVDQGNYNKGMLGGWGIDSRDPTADRRLMEFCLSIPVEQYLTGGVSRALARRAMADRLPAAVVQEKRTGYQAADWHEGLTASRGQLADEVARLPAVPAAAEALDTDRMTRLVQNWPEGNWHESQTTRQYRHALLRGVSAGHFLRKATQSNQ